MHIAADSAIVLWATMLDTSCCQRQSHQLKRCPNHSHPPSPPLCLYVRLPLSLSFSTSLSPGKRGDLSPAVGVTITISMTIVAQCTPCQHLQTAYVGGSVKQSTASEGAALVASPYPYSSVGLSPPRCSPFLCVMNMGISVPSLLGTNT